MNKHLITLEKNNKYYIKDDFYNPIEEVIFFDHKTQKKLLVINGRQLSFKTNQYNTLYKTNQIFEAEAKSLILTNEPQRKLKENLKEKNHFYISKPEHHYSYIENKIYLYINVNVEQIEIKEGEEFEEEMSKGRFWIYKKYYFKNLFIEFSNLIHVFYTEEEFNLLDYKTIRNYELKKIDDELLKEEKFKDFKPVKKYIERLKEIKKVGFAYIGFDRITTSDEALETKIFVKSYDTPQKQNFDQNIKFLKENITNDNKIKDLFKKFNIDIEEVNFNDLMK